MPYKCKITGCGKPATRGYPGQALIRCTPHVEPNMIPRQKVDNRICRFLLPNGEICGKRYNFGFPGEKAVSCEDHMEDGMINVNSKKCETCIEEESKDPITASFGVLGTITRRWCSRHCPKDTDTIKYGDLTSRLCTFVSEDGKECRKNATYGTIKGKPDRCAPHKDMGMTDVKNKKCEKCIEEKSETPIQATFGYTKPTHCFAHKETGMLDQRHDTEMCIESDCKTRASYGYEDDDSDGGKATHCGEHRLDFMVDLVSDMCHRCEKVQPSWQGPDGFLYCKTCKPEESKNTHIMCACGEHQPTFNYKGETVATHCLICKEFEMVDVRNPRCANCTIFIVRKKGLLCQYCDQSGNVRKKLKEQKVVDFLREKGLPFVHNKRIKTVNGTFMPDVLIKHEENGKVMYIIVEIDEYQHRIYDLRSEIIRMASIQTALKKNCYFIRYNPDNFKVNGRKDTKYDSDRRLKKLFKRIHRVMREPMGNFIHIVKFFYDIETDLETYSIQEVPTYLIDSVYEDEIYVHFAQEEP